ncbi:YokU family protein [Paenibacillus sp. Soil522]|uniref:YokU family protein n=1 Tax=Paenibacillus sp. Soil522 TaxID=1736388 RepID=UPI000702328C|nr:YokU family protein [Paenibacillus sp. Soil522]KRE47371.1 hypothetical protein ASG81_08675 [Paenibacillus sp. Soil522]
MKCIWCDAEDSKEGVIDCYWIMPDGKSSVEILEIPAIDCPRCSSYVSESMSQKVEEALYLNDVSALGSRFRYEELMNAPRINKFYFK